MVFRFVFTKKNLKMQILEKKLKNADFRITVSTRLITQTLGPCSTAVRVSVLD